MKNIFYYLKNVSKRFKRIILLIFFTAMFYLFLKSENLEIQYKSFYLILFLIPIIYFSTLLFEDLYYHKSENNIDYITHRILTFAMLTMLISPLFVYIFALYFRISKDFIIKIGNTSDWIQFAGSIIGGGLTLIAIVFAFTLEKEFRELEIDKTQVPKLHIDTKIGKNNRNSYDECAFLYNDSSNDTYIHLDLKLINISNYSAKNINLISCEFIVCDELMYGSNIDTKPLHQENLHLKFFKNIKDLKILFGDYSIDLNLPIYVSRSILEFEEYPIYILKTKLSYTSQFEQITYILDSTVLFKLSFNSFDNKKNSDDNFEKIVYFLKIFNIENNLSIEEKV